jgi:hypothetical protein
LLGTSWCNIEMRCTEILVISQICKCISSLYLHPAPQFLFGSPLPTSYYTHILTLSVSLSLTNRGPHNALILLSLHLAQLNPNTMWAGRYGVAHPTSAMLQYPRDHIRRAPLCSHRPSPSSPLSLTLLFWFNNSLGPQSSQARERQWERVVEAHVYIC